jgi:4-amino-4-deoxy-L-arabinose transferase-like glycosyltransferase
VAGAVVSLALALAVFDFYMFTGGDNAAYYALARALATGRGYVDLISPNAPPATQYPPGFPLLLVPFYWIFGGAYTPLKIVSFLAGAAALMALYRLARREEALPAWGPPAAVWLLGLYPVFRIYTHWVLSDMAYVAATLAALALFAKAASATTAEGSAPAGGKPAAGKKKGRGVAERKPRRPVADDPWGMWLAASLVGAFAFSIRTAGITLLVAPVLWAAWHRAWRRAGVAAVVAMIAAGAWFGWVQTNPPERGGYLRQMRVRNRLDPTSGALPLVGFVDRGVRNAEIYGTGELPQMVWPLVVPPAVGPWQAPPLPVRVFGGIFLLAAMGYGAVLALRRRGLAVWDIHAALSLGLILAWAWTGDRFYLTVAPFLWLYFLIGIDQAARLFARSARPAIAVVAAIAALQIAGAAREVPSQLRLTRAWLDGDELGGYVPFWQDYFEAAQWIGETAPDAIIVARKPTLAWYWSGFRPAYVYPFHSDPERTWQEIRRKGGTHILLESMSQAFLAPTLEPHADQLDVVHAAPRRSTLVVAIRPEPR